MYQKYPWDQCDKNKKFKILESLKFKEPWNLKIIKYLSILGKLEDGCTDDDECLLNIHHCDPMATCKNTNGSYDCICQDGFSGDGYDCKDVNECLKNNGGCSPDARCINTIGSHRCLCDNGFSGR